MAVDRSLNLRPAVIDIADILDGIQVARFADINVSANSYTDTTWTFPKRYKSTPYVVVAFQTASTAGAFGQCTIATNSVGTSSCNIRIYNGSTTARVPGCVAIAIGELA